MIENPFARITQRVFEAMIEAVQEEMGQVSQQLVQGILTPDRLVSLVGAMQQSLEIMGFDIGRFVSMAGQQPGYDPYRVLGLERSATDDEVKKRYRELLRHLHPDTAGDKGTVFFFQQVQAAYESIKKERGW